MNKTNASFYIMIVFISVSFVLVHDNIIDTKELIDHYAYKDSVSTAIQLNKLDSIGIELKALKIDLYSVEE